MAKGKKSQAIEINIEDRRAKALDLRRAGASLRQIADRLDISHEQARLDIKAALDEAIKENVDNADQLRTLELERLDRIALGLSSMVFPKADAMGNSRPPDLKAVDRYLRISEQRAKLLGLYMPVKQEVSGQITIAQKAYKEFSPDDWDADTPENQ